jgi:hypothetical protein
VRLELVSNGELEGVTSLLCVRLAGGLTSGQL